MPDLPPWLTAAVSGAVVNALGFAEYKPGGKGKNKGKGKCKGKGKGESSWRSAEQPKPQTLPMSVQRLRRRTAAPLPIQTNR